MFPGVPNSQNWLRTRGEREKHIKGFTFPIKKVAWKNNATIKSCGTSKTTAFCVLICKGISFVKTAR
jgi:hypothetical protein